MRPVISTQCQDELIKVSMLLEDNGIPVFVKEVPFAYRNPDPLTYVICLWFDNQYDEALNLLRDPDYHVKNPISREDFERLDNLANEQMTTFSNAITDKILNWLVSFVVIGLVVGIAYFAVHSKK